MKPAKKIEKLIKKSRYKASPEAYDKALSNFLQAVDTHEKQKPALTEPNIWRIIMKSRITKLAVAAVVIIGIVFGVNYFGGSIDGASVAFADVIEKLDAVFVKGSQLFIVPKSEK